MIPQGGFSGLEEGSSSYTIPVPHTPKASYQALPPTWQETQLNLATKLNVT